MTTELKRTRIDSTLNEPRVIVYVTPRPLDCMTQNYMPPEDDCARIRDLWAANVTPQLNAAGAPSAGDVRSCCGYVLIEGEAGEEIEAPLHRPQFLVRCSAYPATGVQGARILILHWYPIPLTDAELDAMAPLWSAFYGLTPPDIYTLPSEYEYLVERGVLGAGKQPTCSTESFDPVGTEPKGPLPPSSVPFLAPE